MAFAESNSMSISYWYHRRKDLVIVSAEEHDLNIDVRAGIVYAL